jgi:putative flippase GtrA
MTAQARLLQSLRADHLVAQFARFLVVGVSNTALSLIVYTALLAFGTPYWLSGAAAFAAGALNGYVLNRRWTFASPDSPAARARYLAVQLGGLGATTGLLWLLVSAAAVDRLGAYLFTIPTVTVATFLANRSWTFALRLNA